MGRGGYDLTDPKEDTSNAGAAAVFLGEIERDKREKAAAEKAARDEYEKLVRSKKSRGIMAARRAEKDGVAASSARKDG